MRYCYLTYFLFCHDVRSGSGDWRISYCYECTEQVRLRPSKEFGLNLAYLLGQRGDTGAAMQVEYRLPHCLIASAWRCSNGQAGDALRHSSPSKTAVVRLQLGAILFKIELVRTPLLRVTDPGSAGY